MVNDSCLVTSKISGYYGSDCEENCLLGCDTVQSGVCLPECMASHLKRHQVIFKIAVTYFWDQPLVNSKLHALFTLSWNKSSSCKQKYANGRQWRSTASSQFHSGITLCNLSSWRLTLPKASNRVDFSSLCFTWRWRNGQSLKSSTIQNRIF